MYSRRQVLAAGGAATAAAVLAACGGSSSGGGTGAAVGSTEVLYDWTYLGPGVRTFWNAAQSRSSGKAKITQMTGVPFSSLFQTVQTQNTAKSGADLFANYPDYHAFRLMTAGSISAIDPYVPAGETDHWLLASANFDGKNWGSPLCMEIAVMVINRRHFDKAKIDVDTQFESWDAFIEACDKLKAAGITPIQTSSADQLGTDKWTMLLELQVTDSPADLMRGVVGDLPIDAPPFSYWMDTLPMLRDKYMNTDGPKINEQVSVNRFLGGDGGIQLMYTAPIFAPDVGSEFEVIGFPKSSAGFNRPAIGSGDTMDLASYAGDKADAGAVLTYLHQPNMLSAWWKATGTLPADDRFDASVLKGAAKTTWDLVMQRKSDVYSMWWPDNFFPPELGDYNFALPASVLAGMSSSDAKKKAEDIFELFRKQNPQGVELLKQGIPVIDAVAKKSAA